jgi:predicted signal transduction protein with EAL and GGDEF domain
MDVAKLARTVIHNLSQPVNFHGTDLHTEISVGVAITPADGRDQIQLVKAAEVAAVSAHDSGRNSYRFFDAGVERIAERQRGLRRFVGEAQISMLWMSSSPH